ncbi:alkaline phosphatase family protein [bacterium]|nr:alkaline phosphatase family protein [bacterium]
MRSLRYISVSTGILCLLVGLFVFEACQRTEPKGEDQWSQPPEQSAVKVLLGIDGADWRFLVPLIKQGKLPALEKLVQRGSYGQLISQTMASPVEWTIIATGQTPERNGITGFVVHDEKKGKKAVVSGNLRKVQAFWNILTDTMKAVQVIGWWATWPAEKIQGVLISDLFPFRDTIQQTCSPRDVRADLEQVSLDSDQQLERILELDFQINPDIEGVPAVASDDYGNETEAGANLGLFRRDFKYDLEKARYFDYLVTQGYTGQMALFLNSTDIASHLFYRCGAHANENGGWSENRVLNEKYNRVIEMAYRYAELPLHTMFENISDLAFVCIVSDHGFRAVPYTLTARWNVLLHKMGLVHYEPGQTPGLFRSIDWHRTLAYYDPRKPNPGLAISLNPEYRSERNVIDSGRESNQPEEIVRMKISQVHLENGEQLFSYLGQDQQTGQMLFKPRPLTFEANRRIYFEQHSLSFSELFFPPKLSGGHRPEGILLLWGQGINSGKRLPDATTYDITPTLLWANNLPASKEMVGHPIEQALSGQALASRPPLRVASYGPRANEPAQSDLADEIDDQIKIKLKALGYID